MGLSDPLLGIRNRAAPPRVPKGCDVPTLPDFASSGLLQMPLELLPGGGGEGVVNKCTKSHSATCHRARYDPKITRNSRPEHLELISAILSRCWSNTGSYLFDFKTNFGSDRAKFVRAHANFGKV